MYCLFWKVSYIFSQFHIILVPYFEEYFSEILCKICTNNMISFWAEKITSGKNPPKLKNCQLCQNIFWVSKNFVTFIVWYFRCFLSIFRIILCIFYTYFIYSIFLANLWRCIFHISENVIIPAKFCRFSDSLIFSLIFFLDFFDNLTFFYTFCSVVFAKEYRDMSPEEHNNTPHRLELGI